jgi:YVTN family beta-propeller protein
MNHHFHTITGRREKMKWKDKVIIANMGDDSLSVIDSLENREVQRISLKRGAGPCSLVQATTESCILVIQSHDNSLVCYNLSQMEVENSVLVGSNPNFAAVDVMKNRLYVSNADSDSISILDVREFKLIGQITVGSMPQGIDIHPSSMIMAVANMNSHAIWILDNSEYNVIKKIRVEGYPSELKFSKCGSYLYTTCFSLDQHRDGRVVIINLKDYTMKQEILVGCIPLKLIETQDGRFLMVTSTGKGCLDVIDMQSKNVVKRIETGGMAHSVALGKYEKYAYITNIDEGTVAIIDWKSGKKIVNIPVGKEPNGILYIH